MQPLRDFQVPMEPNRSNSCSRRKTLCVNKWMLLIAERLRLGMSRSILVELQGRVNLRVSGKPGEYWKDFGDQPWKKGRQNVLYQLSST